MFNAKSDTIEILHAKSKNEFSNLAAKSFCQSLKSSPQKKPIVILPTGNTPLPLYAELRNSEKKLDFIYFQLDEYIGLEPSSKRLFTNWLADEILDPMDIPHEQRITFRSDNLFPQDEIDMMRSWYKENGPADIAVLGIGANGHIGFNEPPSDENSQTRLVKLSNETLKSNNAYWDNDKKAPEYALTLGISEILHAKKIILLATGKSKAIILKKALTEPPSPEIPASYLQNHPNVTVIADAEALSEFKS